MDLCVGQSCSDDSDFKDVPGKSSAGRMDERVGVCFGLCTLAMLPNLCRPAEVSRVSTELPWHSGMK